MTNLKALQAVGKNLVVLYVEDQEEIRIFTKSILENFFKEVLVAKNGEEGLYLFLNNKFDMVITDIQMPKMTGLEMVKEIKKIDEFMPVVITTAFNDEDYFLDSIELGVDRYILKPLEPKKLTSALYAVSLAVNNRIKAKEYEQKLIQEKINKATSNAIDKVANSFPVGCIVYTNDDVRFINSTFGEIISEKNLKKLANKEMKLDDLFQKQNDYLTSLKELSENKDLVVIQTDKGKGIFRVNLKEVDLDCNGVLSKIFSFSDITLLEYQKNKIKNFNEVLKDVLFTKFKKTNQEDKIALIEPKRRVLILNEDEKNILRKSQKHKTTAIDYLNELDESILEELLDMQELENELKDELHRDLAFSKIILNVSQKILTYSSVIKSLIEFEDLAFALSSLSNLIENLNDNLDEKKKRKILTILEAIISDLSSWRKTISLDKNALDIHYLDSSLFSSCVQIELELSDNHTVDDNEILELF